MRPLISSGCYNTGKITKRVHSFYYLFSNFYRLTIWAIYSHDFNLSYFYSQSFFSHHPASSLNQNRLNASSISQRLLCRPQNTPRCPVALGIQYDIEVKWRLNAPLVSNKGCSTLVFSFFSSEDFATLSSDHAQDLGVVLVFIRKY